MVYDTLFSNQVYSAYVKTQLGTSNPSNNCAFKDTQLDLGTLNLNTRVQLATTGQIHYFFHFLYSCLC